MHLSVCTASMYFPFAFVVFGQKENGTKAKAPSKTLVKLTTSRLSDSQNFS